MPITPTSLLAAGKTVIETIKTGKELFKKQKVQLEAVTVDTVNCSWRSFDNIANAFVNKGGNQSPFPILSFSFINNIQKTILLTAIELKAKHLYSGLSGIPQAKVLEPLIKYKMPIPPSNKSIHFPIEKIISVPVGEAFQIQLELYSEGMDNEKYAVDGRKVLYFKFKFGNSPSLTAPKIFLNCKDENEKVKVVFSS